MKRKGQIFLCNENAKRYLKTLAFPMSPLDKIHTSVRLWRGALTLLPVFFAWILLAFWYKHKQGMQANTLYNISQHTPHHLHIKSLQVQTLDKWGPAISSGTFLLLKNESLIRKAVTLHGYSGNSSSHMSMHIKSYKQPTHTSHSNKSQAKSRYN